MKTFLIISALLFFGYQSATHAHTMSNAECDIFARDMRVAAVERDHKVMMKTQMAEAASGTENCRLRRPVLCVYKDQDDNVEAINELAWMYNQGSKLTPIEVEAHVAEACQIHGARVMESLRQSHGAK